MNEIEATKVLRRYFPAVPQRRLATILDTQSVGVLPGFEQLGPRTQADIRDAFRIAQLGLGGCEVPSWATIYGRIRRADKQIAAEAQQEIDQQQPVGV